MRQNSLNFITPHKAQIHVRIFKLIPPGIRVTRWVCEKVAQNIAQYIICQTLCIAFIVENSSLKFLGYFCDLQKNCPK
jgi:hypothetical protein